MRKSDLRQHRILLILALATVFSMGWLGAANAQEIAIAPRFEAAGNFHKGVAAAKENGQWGLIDKTGEWVVYPTYEAVTVGGDGVFGIESGGQWGYVNARGVTVINPQYEAAGPFEGGVAPVKKDGLWGYITIKNQIDVPFELSELGGREGDVIAARNHAGWVVISRSAGEWYAADPDPAVIRYYSVSEGAIVAKVQDGEVLTIGEGRIEESDPVYLSIKKRSQGLSAASLHKDKWGYIDDDGEFLWPDRYEEAGPFVDSLAPAKTAGKWGFIDRSGDFVVTPAYDAAFPFRDGLAVVRKGELRGFLKNDPERGIYEFIKPTYQDAFRFTEGLAPVKIGDKWGYVSSGKQPLIEDVVDIEPPQ